MTILGIQDLSKHNEAELKWAFDQIGNAPVPTEPQEYWDGVPSWIIPFTKFGFVARISTEISTAKVSHFHFKLPLVRHSQVLRPLGAIKAGDFRIDLQPGWTPGTSASDALQTYRHAKRFGVEIEDLADYNCLYLPNSKSNDFPNGYPVVFDPRRVWGAQKITNMLNPNVYDLSPLQNQTPDLQDKVYGHLRQAFAEVCDPDQKDLIPEKMNKFLLMCRTETEKPNGILHPHWATEEYMKMFEQEEDKYLNMQEIAKEYDKKLSQSLRIQAIMEQELSIKI